MVASQNKSAETETGLAETEIIIAKTGGGYPTKISRNLTQQ